MDLTSLIPIPSETMRRTRHMMIDTERFILASNAAGRLALPLDNLYSLLLADVADAAARTVVLPGAPRSAVDDAFIAKLKAHIRTHDVSILDSPLNRSVNVPVRLQIRQWISLQGLREPARRRDGYSPGELLRAALDLLGADAAGKLLFPSLEKPLEKLPGTPSMGKYSGRITPRGNGDGAIGLTMLNTEWDDLRKTAFEDLQLGVQHTDPLSNKILGSRVGLLRWLMRWGLQAFTDSPPLNIARNKIPESALDSPKTAHLPRIEQPPPLPLDPLDVRIRRTATRLHEHLPARANPGILLQFQVVAPMGFLDEYTRLAHSLEVTRTILLRALIAVYTCQDRQHDARYAFAAQNQIDLGKFYGAVEAERLHTQGRDPVQVMLKEWHRELEEDTAAGRLPWLVDPSVDKGESQGVD